MKKYLVAYATGEHISDGNTVDGYQMFVDGDSSEQNKTDADAFYESLLKRPDILTANVAVLEQSTDFDDLQPDTEDLMAELAKRGYCTDSLWSIDDVDRALDEVNKYRPICLELTPEQKMAALEILFGHDADKCSENDAIQAHLEENYPPEDDGIDHHPDVSFINYEGVQYPIREIYFLNSHVTLGVQSLAEAMGDPDEYNEHAEILDNQIYYYVEDSKINIPNIEMVDLLTVETRE